MTDYLSPTFTNDGGPGPALSADTFNDLGLALQAAHARLTAIETAAPPYTDEQAQDAVAAALAAGTQTGVVFSYNDATGALSASVTAAGYSDEQAQDAAAAMVLAGVHTGISFSYDDATGALTATVTAGAAAAVWAPAPSGVDDLAALAAAQPAAGTLMLQAGTYKLSGQFTVGDGQDVQGQGGNLAGSATTLLCTGSGAGVTITDAGGVTGNLCIDGGGVAMSPLQRTLGTSGAQRTFLNLSVIGALQDNVTVTGAQNDTWIGCNAQYPGRDNLVLDQGTGGNAWYRCEYNGAHRHQLRISDDVPSGPYAAPTDNTFHHCIFEREDPGGSGVSSVLIECNADHLVFEACSFFATQDSTGPRIDITDVASVWVLGGRVQGLSGTDGGIGIRVVDGVHLALGGHVRFEGLTTGVSIVSGNPQIHVLGSIYWAIVGTRVGVAGGASADTSVKAQLQHPLEVFRTATTDRALAVYVDGEAGIRALIDGSGTLGLNDGVGYTPKATLFSGTSAGVLSMPAAQAVRVGRGVTGSRPAAATVGSGGLWYDTTLGALITSNGTVWAAAGGGGTPGLLVQDSFVGKSNGSLTTADSGQTWLSSGAVLAVINGGKVGFPAGQTFPPAGATYAQVDAGAAAACTKVGGTLRFDNSLDTGASVAMGLFTTSGVVTTGTPTASPAHLAVTPTYMQFSVFSNINTDFTSLSPVGFPTSIIAFPSPLKTDGATTYPVEILIDRVNARCWVTVGDNPTVEYQDLRIGSVVGRYPFWESFPNGTATNLGGFTTVWADTAATELELNAVRGASRSRNGSGSVYSRPTSRFRPGATWWDTTGSKLTVSTGDVWRDTAGAQVSNMLTLPQNSATEAGTGMAGSGTITRAITPSTAWRCSTAYKVVVTVAGAQVNYINTLIPITAGQTYTAVVDQAVALNTARTCYVQINWYDAASSPVGTPANNTGALSVSVPTTGPVTIPAVTGVAPAGATQVFVVVNTLAAVVGNGFLFTRFMLANGTFTGYIEP